MWCTNFATMIFLCVSIQRVLSKTRTPSLESLLEEPLKRIYEYRTYLTKLLQHGQLLSGDISDLKVWIQSLEILFIYLLWTICGVKVLRASHFYLGESSSSVDITVRTLISTWKIWIFCRKPKSLLMPSSPGLKRWTGDLLYFKTKQICQK